MKCMAIISSMVTVLLFAACGGWGSLVGWQPTTKHVTPSDISGSWMYDKVVVELNESGTFTITGSAQYDGSGKWQIENVGKTPTVTFYYSDKTRVIGIWFVSELSDGTFAVVGDEGDGDTWRPMERIGKTQVIMVTPTQSFSK